MTKGLAKMTVDTNLQNRERVIDQLRRELVGPAPDGEFIDCSKPIVFATWRDSYGPWRDARTGEEILTRDNPTKRYGLAVLYPFGTQQEEENLEEVGADGTGFIAATSEAETPIDPGEALVEQIGKAQDNLPTTPTDGSRDEFDLSLANSYRPSSIGVSFLAELPEGSTLQVKAHGGRYSRLPIHIEEAEFTPEWWLRHPVSISASFGEHVLVDNADVFVTTSDIPKEYVSIENGEGLNLRVEVFSR